MITKPTDSRKKPNEVRHVDKQFTTRVDKEKSFIEHVNEMRVRFAWATLAVVSASVLAYVFHPYLTAVIQRPFGQTLYFTSPVGGLNFLIKLSVTFGLIIALPVLLFQVAKFFAPIVDSPLATVLKPAEHRPIRTARYFDTITPMTVRAPSDLLTERRSMVRESVPTRRPPARPSAVRSMDIILPSPV